MPTNEERREVAARLRVLASHVPADAELVLDALDLYEGEYIECFEPRCVDRLADLIEPEPERTCKAEQDYDAMEDGIPDCRIWRCSCGEAFPYWRGGKPIFCPNCGAKVASDD